MAKPTLILGSLYEILTVHFSALIFLAKTLSLIIVCLPIYILRCIVSKLKALGPDLGNIINVRSTLFAIDSINTTPELGILICAHLKGDSPDIVNYLRELVLNKIIHVRNENGRLRNEQMQQYKYKWMGFLFWKWDENFDISNHVNFYSSPEIENNSRISQIQLNKIENELLLRPFKKNKSPWEILVARNVESENGEPKSVVLFKLHHSIADGLSLMKMVFEALVQNENNKSLDLFISKPKDKPQSRFHRFIKFCKNVFLAPFQFAKYVIVSKDTNKWVSSKKIKGRNLVTAVSEKVPLNDLKEIANFHQVGLTTVIFAGLAAGMRKAMLRKEGNVPNQMHFNTPAFIPGHPDKLINHMSVVNCRIPVEIPESVERLKKQQSYQDILKDSAIPAVCFIMMGLFGAMFPEMTKYFSGGNAPTTITGSSFPGPKEKVYIDGQEISDLYFYHGATLFNFPILIFFLTYSDGLRFTIVADKSIFENDEQVGELIYDIKEEFCALKAGIYV